MKNIWNKMASLRIFLLVCFLFLVLCCLLLLLFLLSLYLENKNFFLLAFKTLLLKGIKAKESSISFWVLWGLALTHCLTFPVRLLVSNSVIMLFIFTITQQGTFYKIPSNFLPSHFLNIFCACRHFMGVSLSTLNSTMSRNLETLLKSEMPLNQRNWKEDGLFHLSYSLLFKYETVFFFTLKYSRLL